jgi:uncharacterized membrane protein YhhN
MYPPVIFMVAVLQRMVVMAGCRTENVVEY